MEKELNITDIPNNFVITKKDNFHELKIGRSKPIKVQFPIKLDKKLARICAMILDGSLSKDLANCMFSQKKDLSKADEFANIIKERFNVSPRILNRNGASIVVFGNKSLAHFLHDCLDIYKCDENARIPKWILNSGKEITREYLRYAFAMEGSVKDPNIRSKEIKFHSCDELYTKELKNFLKEKFNINSKIQEYFIRGYGKKYYLYITSEEEIRKFAQIGIALESHQKRIERILEFCKPKAWEISLVVLFNLGKNNLSIKEIETAFPYLGCRRSIHERLWSLIKLGYVSHKRNRYNLTKEGKKLAISLKDKIKIVPVRTKPIENEKKILEFISINKRVYRNQLARSLGLPVRTVKDVLERLSMKGHIKQVEKDKFGRKFWKIRGL